jgi:hypothetical protein
MFQLVLSQLAIAIQALFGKHENVVLKFKFFTPFE